MKRFTLIVALVLLAAMPMFAEHVDPETARKVAATFLNNNGAKATQLTDISKAAGFPNLYIFTTEEGFVVMSADDCVKPILGYSLTGPFIAEGMPENLLWWLQGYSDQIQNAINNQMRASSETAKLWKDLTEGNSKAGKTTTVVGPLIQTKWNQSPFYNDMCPYDSQAGVRTITGCVATAMAQIMKFWEYPDHGIGSHSYTHAIYGQQYANFGNATYTWANMPNSINSANSEIAQLMYHCGVSVNMEYGLSSQYGGIGSSAYSYYIPSALINYFNYSDSTNYVERSNYQDEEDWKNLIKAELDKRRPVQYSGSGSGGHAFICDGYDSDGEFHFNWGWGGSNDAFFSIDDLTPGSHNYNDGQTAVIGIKPATIGQATAPNLSVEPVQETGVRNAYLTWNKVDDATKYQIYRNTTLIHTTSSGEEVSFTDVHIPYGTNTYFIRSVDENDNLSWPSNYVDLTLTFTAPTNLSAQSTENGVMLSWSAGENAVSYNVYCNNVLIGSSINTTYIDSRTIAGSLSYFVKSVDALNDESEASETAQITIQYSTPIVESLSASLSDGNTSLLWTTPNWCYPEAPSVQLTYGTQIPSSASMIWGSNTIEFWGHRHLAENISTYNGKKLYKASFYASNIGIYELYIFQGSSVASDNSIIPTELVAYQMITVSELGWNAIDLSTPIVINGEQDLWVFMHNPAPIDNFKSQLCTANGSYGFYYSSNPTSYTFNNVQGYAFLIKAFITDGTYTYNIYDGETKLNSEAVSGLSYTHENPTNNTIHHYTVKTNYYGGESEASNTASLALGSNTLEDLTLENDDNMTIAENSTLSVTGNLTNTNPDNLVIEDGAQLIHNSDGVAATVKKDIAAWTTETNVGGWYFIASPINSTELAPNSVDNMLTDANEENGLRTYDFYRLENDNWKNYRKNAFNLANGEGYLYANESPQTLSFKGEIKPYDAENNSVTLSAGWNLIGNPFTRNVVPSLAYHTLNNGASTTSVMANEGLVAPGMGIAVYSENGGTLSFHLPSESSSAPSNGNLQITLNQQITNRNNTNTIAIDNTIVSFNKSEGLPKFPLLEAKSKLYIPKGNEEYAIVSSAAQGEMPINFKANENGIYTLTVNPENVEMNYLHLIDNLTGNDIDLLISPDYTFEAKTTDYATRFRLVFASVCEDTDDDNENFVFINDGNIIVYKAGTLQIVDMMGRVVYQGDAINRVSTSRMTPGVYVLRLITTNGVKTQKIVID